MRTHLKNDRGVLKKSVPNKLRLVGEGVRVNGYLSTHVLFRFFSLSYESNFLISQIHLLPLLLR